MELFDVPIALPVAAGGVAAAAVIARRCPTQFPNIAIAREMMPAATCTAMIALPFIGIVSTAAVVQGELIRGGARGGSINHCLLQPAG